MSLSYAGVDWHNRCTEGERIFMGVGKKAVNIKVEYTAVGKKGYRLTTKETLIRNNKPRCGNKQGKEHNKRLTLKLTQCFVADQIWCCFLFQMSILFLLLLLTACVAAKGKN